MNIENELVKVAKILLSEGEEYTAEDYKKLAEDIEKTVKSVFPKSYVDAYYSTNLGESITVRFTLGKDKSEWANGIFQNDDAASSIFIWIKKDGSMEIEVATSFGVTVKPSAGSYMAYEFKKVPFRKTKVKAGDFKKVLSVFKKNFGRLKDAVKKNLDNLGHPEFAKGKV